MKSENYHDLQNEIEYLITTSKNIENYEIEVKKKISYKLLLNIKEMFFVIRIAANSNCELNSSFSLIYLEKNIMRIDFNGKHTNPPSKLSKKNIIFSLKDQNTFFSRIYKLIQEYGKEEFNNTEPHFHIFIYDENYKKQDLWAFPINELSFLFGSDFSKLFLDISDDCLNSLSSKIKDTNIVYNIKNKFDYEKLLPSHLKKLEENLECGHLKDKK